VDLGGRRAGGREGGREGGLDRGRLEVCAFPSVTGECLGTVLVKAGGREGWREEGVEEGNHDGITKVRGKYDDDAAAIAAVAT